MTDTPVPPTETGAPAAGGDKPDSHLIPKARLDEEISKRRALEGDMQAVADALLAEVPEHLKALVPADLGPAARIRWFQAAKSTGVFGGTSTTVPTTDTTPPRTTPRDQDLSNLPPAARMARGYGARK
jgi:hypothetical protein